MDDKTAKIPSLEEFKESRREREAQSVRSSSMQTKRQLQNKNTSKKKFGKEKKKKNGKPHGEMRRAADPRYEEINTTRRMNVRPQKEELTRTPRASRDRDTGAEIRNSQRDVGQRRTASDRYDYERFAPRDASTERPRRDVSRDQRKRMPAPETYARYRNGQPNDRRMTRDQRSTGTDRPRASDDRRRDGRVQSRRSSDISKKPKKPLSPAARKFRNICAYTAIILAVLVIGVILSLTVLFKTESINVSGNGKYSADEIVDVSGLHIGENIFTAPKSSAASNIEKRYPAIEKADVYCVFPNAINIDITMAKPAYAIEALGGCYVLSDKCKVLEVVSTDDEIDVPVIEGLSIEGKNAGEYVEFNDDFVSAALEEMFTAFSGFSSSNITAVNFTTSNDGAASLKFVYDNRIVVYLGIPEHITYKVQTAMTIIKEKIDINSAKLAGDLDVSLCYDTNKSYFNQYSLISQPQIYTTSPTEPDESTSPTVIYDY